MNRVIHPIEVESYRILRARVDTSHLPPLTRAVTERIVHTTADPTWVGELVASDLAAQEQTLAVAQRALLAGAPLLADVRMVAAAVTSRDCVVCLDLPGQPPTDSPSTNPTAAAPPVDPADVGGAPTRSAIGIRRAAQRYPDGAVWVIGNAPTALAELVRLGVAGLVRPALVIGLPVGFVGSVAAKSALRASDLPALSNVTERGGAAVAAAAVNALLYADTPQQRTPS